MLAEGSGGIGFKCVDWTQCRTLSGFGVGIDWGRVVSDGTRRKSDAPLGLVGVHVTS